MAQLSLQDELDMCDALCNAQNRAYTLQARAQVDGDDVTAAKFGVDAKQLDVQIELLQDKVNVDWVSAATDAIKTFADAQNAIQQNIAAINNVIKIGQNTDIALKALDEIIQLASKLVPV